MLSAKQVIVGVVLGVCFMCTAPAAYALVCRTPDGFVYQDGRIQFSGDKGIGGTGDRVHHSSNGGNTKGLGGTGIDAEDGKGLGGTGARVAEGKGIGGTGDKIALRGTITGFASVCVNGAEVHYDSRTFFSMGGKPISVDTLKVGQVVSVLAEPASQGGFFARGIDVAPGIVGPIQAIHPQDGVMQVMGQDIRITPGMTGLDRLAPGDVVRINGLQDAGNVVHATLVEKVSPDEPVRMSLDSKLDITGVTRVSVEGYVHAIAEDAIEVDGQRVVLSEDLRDVVEDNQRVLLYGELDVDGQIHAQSLAIEDRTVSHIFLEILGDASRREHKDNVQDRHHGGDHDKHERHDHEHGDHDHDSHDDDNHEGGIDNDHNDHNHDMDDDLTSEAEEGRDDGFDMDGSDIDHDIDEPDPEEPEIEEPEIEEPEIEEPEIEEPEIEEPEIEEPEIEEPEIEEPEIEEPEIEEPEIE